MKKIALLLLPLSIFAFDINFSKKFTKELMPDTLSTNITIRVDSKNEQEISTKLNSFNKKIKSNKDVEKKLGTYNIRPNFKYTSTHTPKIIGYTGELRYKVNSTNAKDIESFIISLNELKTSRDTSITVAGLSWKVKDDTYNVALDILRLEAINWAETYANNLSIDLKKRCKIVSINIGRYSNPTPYRNNRVMAMASVSEKSVPVPEANHQKVTSTTSYKMECK